MNLGLDNLETESKLVRSDDHIGKNLTARKRCCCVSALS